MLLTAAKIKPKSFESRRNSFFLFLFNRDGWASCLRACLGARLLLQSYRYSNLSEGADRVAGQLRGDKECPFSGVTNSGKRCSECGSINTWLLPWHQAGEDTQSRANYKLWFTTSFLQPLPYLVPP